MKSLLLILLFACPLVAQSLRVVPTFHCLGIYWNPNTGGADVACRVNYRQAGFSEWRAAQNLWFDDRQIDGRDKEYRGSIVNLQPGTTYEIQLWLQDKERTTVTTTASTWDEEFPIRKFVNVENSHETLNIDESGEADGYVLYSFQHTPPTIDVQNQQDFCIFLPEGTHHIIIRGLTLKGAARHVIRLSDNCHDIVIEQCDLSGWGNADSTGYGINLQAAISAPYRADHIERLIIQNNKIHHPRSHANSWGEPRPNPDGDPYHPQGPYGIVLYDTRGNHVIRYNQFYTDDNHYFCDILGAGSNISHAGFPNKDSDIYGNYFERCWDDAIEAEGANENVRIWDNEIDQVYHPIGAIVTSVGPLYIWRNLVKRTRKFGHIDDSDAYGRGEFIKCGGTWDNGLWYGDGRTYIYHNTLLQPLAPVAGKLPLGCEGAFIAEGKSLYNAVSRNNILTNYNLDSYTIRDNPENEVNCGRNDFDFDLYTGRIKETCPDVIYEQNGLHLSSNDDIIFCSYEDYALRPGTPGHDAGILLPNFNDNFFGAAPDMGAVESKIDSHVDIHNGSANPQGLKLYPNSPNPFNAQTRLLFFLPEEANIRVDIFDSRGRLARNLFSGEKNSGYHSMVWDGLSKFHRACPSGVYVARLSVDGKSDSKKILLIR